MTLRLGPDYRQVNAEAQRHDPNSLLSFYRRLIWLRKQTPALQRGSYRTLIERPVGTLAYLRETADQAVLVGLNFFSRPATVDLSGVALPSERWRVLLSSVAREGELVTRRLSLAPCEAVLLEAE